jgi:hypothetical protein
MKKVVLSLIVSSCLTMHAYAKEYIIAVSPHHRSPDVVKQQMEKTLEFITTLEGGDTALVMDGYNVASIAAFKIPTGEAYKSPRARLNANRESAAAMMGWANSPERRAFEGGVRIVGALRLPQLIHHIATEIRHDGRYEVILIGDPIYDVPSELSFSMGGGKRVPSESNLFASRGKTPYSIVGNETLLVNAYFHIITTSNYAADDQYEYQLERFWRGYIHLQGGALVTYASELYFERAKDGLEAPAFTDDFDRSGVEKLEMREFVVAPVGRTPIFDREVNAQPPSKPSLIGAEGVEVGLSWDCPHCDMDLYARPHPAAEIVFFGHKASAEAVYYKDFLNSPQLNKGYETIGFTVPIDLNALQIGVNHFNGDAPNGVTVEVRIAFAGNTYAKSFHLASTSGSGSAAMQDVFAGKVNHSPHRLAVNPLTVLGL